MAIPRGDTTVANQIEAYTSTTLSLNTKQNILPLYYHSGADKAIEDAIDEIGSTRIVEYTGSSITSAQKTSIGADKIASQLWSSYIDNDSTVFHDGSVGKLIFDGGKIYHFPATADFEDVVDLCHLRMSYLYTADYGTNTQKNTALAAYTNAKNALT
tara:strand:+ start:219 stop:689 length:471 start_codon:yes stop_codon:yes gene_type:complete